MKLTPQARRLVSSAAEMLSDQNDRTKLCNWVVNTVPTAEMPYPVAEIALKAIRAEARKIEISLSAHSLEEDEEADLLNDLGYVQAIERGLREAGVGA